MPVVIGPAVAGSDDGGLHAVVENGFGCTPQGLECTIVATQDRGQFLVPAEPSPEPPAAAHDEQEQVNPVLPVGFIGEGHPEFREVNLGLLAGRCLETLLEFHRRLGPDLAEMGGQDGISSPIAAVPDLVEQALPRQLGETLQPVRDIVPVGIQFPRPWCTGLVPGFLQAVPQILGYGTPVVSGMVGDGPNRHSLLLKLMKIHNILQCQHHKISSARFFLYKQFRFFPGDG